MKDNKHTNFILCFLALFCCVFAPSAVQARDVTFTWTANTETVDGYRLYYKTGTSGGSPYDGTGATEGASPVNTGNVTRFTLSGLDDAETYFFVLTAVAGTLESDYSTELILDPLPIQSPPPGISVTFSWLPNTETNLAGYKIHYGTSSGSYATTTDIGNPTPVNGRIQGEITGLEEGITYYFAATAYDSNGLESDYSTEVVWTATTQSGGAPPTAADSSITTPEDQAITGIVTAGNDSALPISYHVQQDVSQGVLLLETGNGNFTYTPNTDYSGSDSFTFLGRDDNGDSNIATVSITITPVNDAPTATGAAFTLAEDSTFNGQLQAVDPDGDTLTYSTVTTPLLGTLAVNSNGAFSYTPDANATGSDSFTFQVSDGQLTSEAGVSISITSANDPPTVNDIAITINEDTQSSGQLTGQDPEGDSLTYAVVGNPARGTLSLTPSGAFTYTPDTNITGTDSFTFQANDGQAASNTATVTITIAEVNDPPSAGSLALNATEGIPVSGQLQAQDPDGDILSFSVITNPAGGTLDVNTSGAFTYTAGIGAGTSDSFSFQASDGQATSLPGTVSITIQPDTGVTATFSWLPNTETNLAGYTLYYGLASRTYDTTQDAGNPAPINERIQTQVEGLTEGVTYYFAVTAYNTEGEESDYSAEITWTASSQTTPPPIEGNLTGIFGDTADSNHPGALADTFTNTNDTIYATSDHLNTWAWSSPTPHKPANTIVIKADLSTLGKDILVTDAKLYLYQISSHGGISYDNSIHKITGINPTIDQVTGNNAFNGGLWTPVPDGTTSNNVPLGLADIAPAEDTLTLDDQAGYKIWTITRMVQDWVGDPAANYGLLISGVPTATETGRTFASSENENETFRPKLIIDYIKKPATPNVISAEQVQ